MGGDVVILITNPVRSDAQMLTTGRLVSGYDPGVWVTYARWVLIAFITFQVGFFALLNPQIQEDYRRVLFLLIPMVILNIGAATIGRSPSSTVNHYWAIGEVIVDSVLAIVAVTWPSHSSSGGLWVLLSLPMLHAAARWSYVGMVSVYLPIVAFWMWREINRAQQPGEDLIPTVLTFQLGILLTFASIAAALTSALQRRMQQIDALNSLATATQRMSILARKDLLGEVARAVELVGFDEVQLFATSAHDKTSWTVEVGDDEPLPTDPETNQWCNTFGEHRSHSARAVTLRDDDWPEALSDVRADGKVLIAVPVRAADELLGILIARHNDPILGYKKKTLMLMASHAGTALASARRALERERYERRLTHQATHDSLTGLPNREFLRQRISDIISRCQSLDDDTDETEVTGLLLLDLDRFKEVNDTLGHAYGDALLVQVANRLAYCLRSDDIAARLGGDEFAVLASDLGTVDDAVALSRRILHELHQPFVVEGITLDIEASIGVAVYPDSASTAEDLVRCADVAMYNAKSGGQGVSVYQRAYDYNTPKRLAILGDMRRAFEEGDQLALHYQPILDVTTNQLAAAEALVRWDHPEYGIVPPGQFVTAAEHTGLIHSLTSWVLGAGLAQATEWADIGIDVPVTVNLSTRSLMTQSLPEEVEAFLVDCGVLPSQLRLEITESSIMADPSRAVKVLKGLADLGVSLAIDDFGTGYSSMSYLKDLPVHELKIDQSFVTGLHEQPRNRLLVSSLIELAHNLDLKVVAEGVEARDTLEILGEMGCDFAQGYYIGRPMPADRFVVWEQGQRAKPLVVQLPQHLEVEQRRPTSG